MGFSYVTPWFFTPVTYGLRGVFFRGAQRLQVPQRLQWRRAGHPSSTATLLKFTWKQPGLEPIMAKTHRKSHRKMEVYPCQWVD